MSDNVDVQSCFNVFPIGIFTGKENSEAIRTAFSAIIKELDSLSITNSASRAHTVNFVMVADLKAMWELLNIDTGSCPFCFCNNTEERLIGCSCFHTFERELDKDLVLFPSLQIQGKRLYKKRTEQH